MATRKNGSSTKAAAEVAEVAPEAIDEVAALFADAEMADFVADETAGADVATGPVAQSGRSLPGVEYFIERDGKKLYPVRDLPRSLWPFVADPANDPAFCKLVEAAVVELDGGVKFNVLENALLTTGTRTLDRGLALLPATNPTDRESGEVLPGFRVDIATAKRSWVWAFQGTDAAVPMSGYLGMKPALDFCTPIDGDDGHVLMPSNMLKNRIIIADDKSSMIVVCGCRTSLSWGNDKASQVYINVGAASTERMVPVAQLAGRGRHIAHIAKRLSFVDAVSREHGSSALSREGHLLAHVGLKQVYYGRPKRSKDSVRPGLHAQLAFVLDPKVNPKVAANWKATGAYVYEHVDVNIG